MIRAKILKDRWIGKTKNERRKNKPRYDILVTMIWKGEDVLRESLNKTKKIQPVKEHHDHYLAEVYTSPLECNATLKVGKRYILTGSVLNSRLYTTLCYWNVLWHDVDKTTRKHFKTGISCNCSIEPCFGGACNHGTKSCQWDIGLYPPPCSYRLCKKHFGVCTWSKTIKINMCKKA